MLLSALESSTDCAKILTLDGRLLFMNDEGCRLMDLPSFDAVAGRPWDQFWPEEVRSVVAEAVRAAAAGERRRFQGECPTAAGERKTWDVVVSPLKNAAGEVEAVLAMSRDITDLVQARREADALDRAISRKSAALRAAGLLAKLGGWEIDFRTGQVFWSDEVWTLLKGEPRDLRLGEAMTIYSEADREWIGALFEHARTTGERIRFEARVTCFDGSRTWARIIGEPELEDGVCTVLRGAAQDISDERRALDDLARTERRLKVALELANLHVYEVDYVNRTLISEGAEDTFFEQPITYERMWSDPFWAVDPRDRESSMHAWAHAEATGEPYRAEYRVNRSDGQVVWAHSAAALVRDAKGRPIRLVGALQNITARKQAEQEITAARDAAEAANRAKTAFLANMSHEIRTPLNGILGMVQVLERDQLSPLQCERVRVIRQSGETLMAVLNDVLDISKIEAGRMELDEHEFQLSDCVDAACRPFQEIAAQKDLALRVDISEAACGVWRGDGLRIRQIVANLVSNAVKFTAEGEVRVEADVVDGRLEVRISDTGIGIPADRLQQLFQKFTQADSSTSRKFGGTGLGLAISRELAVLMGGDLSAQSGEGGGSCFTLSLPLQRVEGAAFERVEAEAAPETLGCEAAIRVLAAEDNPTNQLILRSLLEPLGLDLLVVSDGAQAVEAARSASFDVILMDIQMPVMSGVEATRLIRQWEAENGARATPIIALSANVMEHQTHEYAAAGMTGFVPKPIEFGKLVSALEAALSGPSEEPQPGACAAEAGQAAG